MQIYFNDNFKSLLLSLDLVKSIGQINEYKGKIDVYHKTYPGIFKELQKSTKIKYIETQIKTHPKTKIVNKRIQQLIRSEVFPKTKIEDEIFCYNEVLSLIHDNHKKLKLSSEFISELHFQLFKYHSSDSGRWRQKDLIIPNSPMITFFLHAYKFKPHVEIQSSINQLCNEYNVWDKDNHLEPITSICNFILTLAYIIPFDFGNIKLARLLFHLFLLQKGHIFIKYICLDNFIQKYEREYLNAFYKSSANLYDKEHNITFWLEVLVKIILEAYEELVNYIEISCSKNCKIQRIRDFINRHEGAFTKEIIRQKNPDIGESTINRALKSLQNQGNIQLVCRGRTAQWMKIPANHIALKRTDAEL
ncbi:Fic family protein [Bacillus sp. IBL03825]|uniref:Fic family protein n=1 Tax=Bacillus sp. IBL03825 TaxID=2953580 RepID=UPI002157A176|nr:Fic family protein [Bacillus sp. IBL03825]MCR6850450.1 Fic family protein [Bacillus sp. IBL03825]